MRGGVGIGQGADPRRMATAVRQFLDAAGIPLRGELRRTPARVAQVWQQDFLDGYRGSPADALGELYAAPGSDLVCATGLDFHSSCPHHLLPYRGLAHLAYLPGPGVVGFSRLAKLVDVLAHRLVIQEVLAREIAEALQGGARALGAGCVLEAEQACLSCRGEARSRAVTTAEAYVGRFSRSAELRQRFAAAIEAGRGGVSRGR
jgi:GTP cyclohydrolase I